MKLYNFHKVEDLTANELAEGRLAEVPVAGKRIGLLRKGDAIHAFAALCPHAGAPLCQGWLDGQGRIVCPLHKYRFDPASGRNVSGEGYKLFTYPVEIRDGAIFVGLLADAM